jgi:1-acyl-sn-glycerol-3-phosphate acyltransferase
VTILRNIVFCMICYPVSVLLVVVAVLAALTGQAGVIWGSRNWALWHRFCARHLLGITMKIEGGLDQGQALYVIKHESMYEAIDTLALFAAPVVVMKQELLDVPLWGFASRKHGSIGVNREAGGAAMRAMITAAKAAKASGRPIILFPEGTRVPRGAQPPLKAGLAGLYKILDLPVIPIALDTGRVWPRRFLKRAGVVTLRVGATIPPGLPREEIERRVHTAINALNDPAVV